jgi:hypothetical protein
MENTAEKVKDHGLNQNLVKTLTGSIVATQPRIMEQVRPSSASMQVFDGFKCTRVCDQKLNYLKILAPNFHMIKIKRIHMMVILLLLYFIINTRSRWDLLPKVQMYFPKRVFVPLRLFSISR